MGKFCFPSCCFSSSSLPRKKTISGLSTPPSSSQQPANAGPSHPPPSSSQTSQQPADLTNFLNKFNDVSQLHHLINFIEDLLKNASGEKCEGGCSSEVGSYIQGGQTFLGFVDKHVDKHIIKLSKEKDLLDDFNAEAMKALDLLKGSGKIHWVEAAFSVVGFVLTRFNEMLSNKRECLDILKFMINLGKQIVELNEEMPEQKQELDEAVECIVVGCCICTSQLATSKIFRFLTASVNAERLKGFQVRIDRLYNDLQLWGIIDIQQRLTKTAPQSQEIHTHKLAVGIDNEGKEVIRLLDLSAQDTSPKPVVVHGFGGTGKTTLTDDVYKNIDLQSYNHCILHIVQHCSKNDLRALQEQILSGLFNFNVKFRDCDEVRGRIWSYFKHNPSQPLILCIDNGLQREDLKELLPRYRLMGFEASRHPNNSSFHSLSYLIGKTAEEEWPSVDRGSRNG